MYQLSIAGLCQFTTAGDNIDGFDHDDTILREWKRDGDDAIRIFFREDARFIRFPMDRVKVRVIERPWMDPWPEPLTVEPV